MRDYIQIHDKRVDADLVRYYLGVLWVPYRTHVDIIHYDTMRSEAHNDICESVGYKRFPCGWGTEDDEESRNNERFLAALDVIICNVLLCLECEVSVGGSMLCPQCRKELTMEDSLMMLETFVKTEEDDNTNT